MECVFHSSRCGYIVSVSGRWEMLLVRTQLYCCKVYKNVPHVQRSDSQDIQDMSEHHLGCKFLHDRVYMKRQRQHLQQWENNVYLNYTT